MAVCSIQNIFNPGYTGPVSLGEGRQYIQSSTGDTEFHWLRRYNKGKVRNKGIQGNKWRNVPQQA